MQRKIYIVVNEFTGALLLPVAFHCKRTAEAKGNIHRERIRKLIAPQHPVGFRVVELHENTSTTVDIG